MAVWRLQTKTGGTHIGNYCIRNHVAAMGWSLTDCPQNERQQILTYSDYEKYADEAYGTYHSVTRLAKEVQADDLIWMRVSGKYYLGRVTQKSKWFFNADDEACAVDAANQLTHIDWYHYEEADESTVPGAIATSFIKGSTIQRIHKSGIEQFSKLIYNQLTEEEHYPISLENTAENFYSLLSTDDCEDLLCLWLYDQYHYVCVPSTCKLGTQLYECVLMDPMTGKHIYVQVKEGNVDIDANEYQQLQGDVWFLTTGGKVLNLEGRKNRYRADPVELYQFALSEQSDKILSSSIKAWANFLKANEWKQEQDIKGILFDTNLSYDPQSQDYMLLNSRVSAWGNSQKFIDRFNKSDYVLYYQKGKGIVAAGQILSEKAQCAGDERYHKTKILIPAQEGVFLSPREIRGLLKHGFYFATTAKTPYLSENEVMKLISALKEKQTCGYLY